MAPAKQGHPSQSESASEIEPCRHGVTPVIADEGARPSGPCKVQHLACFRHLIEQIDALDADLQAVIDRVEE